MPNRRSDQIEIQRTEYKALMNGLIDYFGADIPTSEKDYASQTANTLTSSFAKSEENSTSFVVTGIQEVRIIQVVRAAIASS